MLKITSLTSITSQASVDSLAHLVSFSLVSFLATGFILFNRSTHLLAHTLHSVKRRVARAFCFIWQYFLIWHCLCKPHITFSCIIKTWKTTEKDERRQQNSFFQHIESISYCNYISKQSMEVVSTGNDLVAITPNHWNQHLSSCRMKSNRKEVKRLSVVTKQVVLPLVKPLPNQLEMHDHQHVDYSPQSGSPWFACNQNQDLRWSVLNFYFQDIRLLHIASASDYLRDFMACYFHLENCSQKNRKT